MLLNVENYNQSKLQLWEGRGEGEGGRPEGAENQLRKVYMGGWWWVVVGGTYGGDYREGLDLIEGFWTKIFDLGGGQKFINPGIWHKSMT